MRLFAAKRAELEKKKRPRWRVEAVQDKVGGTLGELPKPNFPLRPGNGFTLLTYYRPLGRLAYPHWGDRGSPEAEQRLYDYLSLYGQPQSFAAHTEAH